MTAEPQTFRNHFVSLYQSVPPSKWGTPLISSLGSRKVFDGVGAASIHGGIQA
jgi:hypothetical protein